MFGSLGLLAAVGFLIGSAGNFAAIGTNEVWLWSHVTASWTQVSLPGLVDVVSSAGNFAAHDGGTVHAWDQLDGSVTPSPATGGVLELIGSDGNFAVHNGGAAWAWDRASSEGAGFL